MKKQQENEFFVEIFMQVLLFQKNFSENLMSFITNEPVKPKLEYIVNEKVNAIAPKITNS